MSAEYIKAPLSIDEVNLSNEFEEAFGVTKGIVLTTKKNSSLRYDVVHGFDVVRAAKRAKVEYIPCLVGDAFSDLFISLLDKPSVEEGDLPTKEKPENVIDRAISSYEQIKGFKLSYRKAEKIGKLGKKSTLYDEKRLAKHLDPRVQDMIRDGKLSKSAGRSISYIKLGSQFRFAQKAIENKWTVRDIELAKNGQKDAPLEGNIASDVQSLQTRFEESLKLPVTITPKTRESGLIRFEYYRLDDILSIIERLKRVDTEYTYQMKGVSVSNNEKKRAGGTLTIHYKSLDAVDELAKKMGVEM